MGIEVNSSVSHETEARSSEYTFILFAKQHNDGLEFLVQKEKKSGNFKPIGGAKMLLDVNFEAAALRELKEEAEFYPDPTALISLKDVFFDKQNEDGSLSREQEHMVRSEEHTSELQSPDHLVCRLLLEKKKKY